MAENNQWDSLRSTKDAAPTDSADIADAVATGAGDASRPSSGRLDNPVWNKRRYGDGQEQQDRFGTEQSEIDRYGDSSRGKDRYGDPLPDTRAADAQTVNAGSAITPENQRLADKYDVERYGNSGGAQSQSVKDQRLEDQYAAERYGNIGKTSPQSSGGSIAGVPKREFFIVVCVLILATLLWLGRNEVRGIVSWISAAVSGKAAPLAGAAPGIAKVMRFGKPYERAEFISAFPAMGQEEIAQVLGKQPDLLRPTLYGRTLWHDLAPVLTTPEAVANALYVLPRDGIATPDIEGSTPLHAAAESGSPLWLLALRGAGAEPLVYDKQGRTPLLILLQTGKFDTNSMSNAELKRLGRFGFTIRSIATKDTRFVSVIDLVEDTDMKRYFGILAEVIATCRKFSISVPTLARGDMVGRPPDPLANALNTDHSHSVLGRTTDTKPLWKSMLLPAGSGGLAARIKCLLPEAYPSTIGFLARQAGGMQQGAKTVEGGPASLVREFGGWNLDQRLYVFAMMQALADRSGKAPSSRPGVLPQRTMVDNIREILRIEGDNPAARNPVLMTTLLLDITEPAPEFMAERKLGDLMQLRTQLPKALWQDLSRYLVAAAYVGWAKEKKEYALMGPEAWRKKGGIVNVRELIARGEPAKPLVEVLRRSTEVTPELAEIMDTLVLRLYPDGLPRMVNGKPLVEYVRSLGVQSVVLARIEETLAAKPERPAPAPAPAETVPPQPQRTHPGLMRSL